MILSRLSRKVKALMEQLEWLLKCGSGLAVSIVHGHAEGACIVSGRKISKIEEARRGCMFQGVGGRLTSIDVRYFLAGWKNLPLACRGHRGVGGRRNEQATGVGAVLGLAAYPGQATSRCIFRSVGWVGFFRLGAAVSRCLIQGR